MDVGQLRIKEDGDLGCALWNHWGLGFLFLTRKEIPVFELRCIFCVIRRECIFYSRSILKRVCFFFLFSISVYSSGFSGQKCFGNRKQCDKDSRLWTGQRYQQHRLLQKDHKRKSMAGIWRGAGRVVRNVPEERRWAFRAGSPDEGSFLCPPRLFLRPNSSQTSQWANLGRI